jgi:hypothetical protein
LDNFEKMIYTHPLIDIPAAILTSLGCLDHSLVRLEMPVQMAGFLLPPFLVTGETTTTGATPVTPCIIEVGNERRTRSAEV